MKKPKPQRRAANWTKEVMPLLPDDCRCQMRNILSDPNITDHHKSQFCFEAILQFSDEATDIFRQWLDSKSIDSHSEYPRRWTELESPSDILEMMGEKFVCPDHPNAPKEMVFYNCECSQSIGFRTGCGAYMYLENPHMCYRENDDSVELRGRCPKCHIRHDFPMLVPAGTSEQAYQVFPPEGVLLHFSVFFAG